MTVCAQPDLESVETSDEEEEADSDQQVLETWEDGDGASEWESESE